MVGSNHNKRWHSNFTCRQWKHSLSSEKSTVSQLVDWWCCPATDAHTHARTLRALLHLFAFPAAWHHCHGSKLCKLIGWLGKNCWSGTKIAKLHQQVTSVCGAFSQWAGVAWVSLKQHPLCTNPHTFTVTQSKAAFSKDNVRCGLSHRPADRRQRRMWSSCVVNNKCTVAHVSPLFFIHFHYFRVKQRMPTLHVPAYRTMLKAKPYI